MTTRDRPYKPSDYIITAILAILLVAWLWGTGQELDREQRIKDATTPTTIEFMDPPYAP